MNIASVYLIFLIILKNLSIVYILMVFIKLEWYRFPFLKLLIVVKISKLIGRTLHGEGIVKVLELNVIKISPRIVQK